ncbi:MAG: cytochrome c biogenesis protein CcdA [bacterium]
MMKKLGLYLATSIVLTLAVVGGYRCFVLKKCPFQITHRLHDKTETHSPTSVEKRGFFAKTLDALQKATTNKKISLFYLLLLAFLAGLITSLTPCVYPMIPITIGILQAHAQRTFARNIMSALSYVTGIALVYASLGYASAKATIMFGRWVANPWVIGFVILFFLYMAFSMFGLYQMYIPRFLAHRGNVQTQGSLLKIFLFGMISGSIASPCLTPALAILLSVVAKQGNPIVGFLTLFLFSLGMGTLLIVVGTFSGAMAMLPQAGSWMLQVKKVMGFIMLAACVYFLQNFISFKIALIAYTGISGIATIHFLFLEKIRGKVTIILGLLFGAVTLTLIRLILK